MIGVHKTPKIFSRENPVFSQNLTSLDQLFRISVKLVNHRIRNTSLAMHCSLRGKPASEILKYYVYSYPQQQHHGVVLAAAKTGVSETRYDERSLIPINRVIRN